MMTLESLLYPSLAIGLGIILTFVVNRVENLWDRWRDRRKEKK